MWLGGAPLYPQGAAVVEGGGAALYWCKGAPICVGRAPGAVEF